MDPYEVLGVPRGASQGEIGRAYHELCRKFHPDRHGDNPLQDLAKEKLVQINAAYERIGDAVSRARYEEEQLEASRNNPPPAPPEGDKRSTVTAGGKSSPDKTMAGIGWLVVIGLVGFVAFQVLAGLVGAVGAGLEWCSSVTGLSVVIVGIIIVRVLIASGRSKRS